MNTKTQITPASNFSLEAESQSFEGCRALEVCQSVEPSHAPEVNSQSVFVISEESDETSIGARPDAWLVAAIRHDPPNSAALSELAQRHWRTLFGRCQMITLNRADADDLAQEAWCRVLKSRSNLKPEGNFSAYLHTIAKNLWRDRRRSENRAGTLAANRVVSLEGPVSDQDGDTITLGDAVADTSLLEEQQQTRLMTDIEQALGRVAPLLRGVLVARFLMGESCAEIGRRHSRTEQTVSGWVRLGIQEMKKHFLEIHDGFQLERPL